jgi:MoxR-like ATPase
MMGNFNVSYEDIEALAAPVLRHRVKVNYNAINEHLSIDDVIAKIVKETKKGN